MLIDPKDILGQKEACEVLGISRQRFQQLEKEGRAPEPVVRLGCGPIWSRAQIEEWAAERKAEKEARDALLSQRSRPE